MRFGQHDQLAIVPQWPSGSGRFLSHDVLKRATGARAIQAHNEKPRLMGITRRGLSGKEVCRSWAATLRDSNAMSCDGTMTGLPHRPGIMNLPTGFLKSGEGIEGQRPPNLRPYPQPNFVLAFALEHTTREAVYGIGLPRTRGELSRLVFTLVRTVPSHIDKPIRFPSVPGEGHLLNGIGGWRGQKRAPGE